MQNRKNGVISMRRWMTSLVCTVLLVTADSHAAKQSLLRYHGICDGSAAIAIDNEQLLVGYDETNQWYRFDLSGGHYVESIDYGNQLGIGGSEEIDIEAVATVGGDIWWLGSHGRAGDGGTAANRRTLFRTTRNAPSTVTGESIDLLGQLSALFPAKALSRRPEKGGVNFEGLAGSSQGALMIGVRAPLSKGTAGRAMVIEWHPRSRSSSVHWLDIDDRGIRALARFDEGYLLIAGGAKSRGKTALYFWLPGNMPIELPILDARVRAEAIVKTADRVLILADDGKVKRGDKRAKKGERNCDAIRRKHPSGDRHPNVYFRAQSISLAAIRSALKDASR